MLPYFAQPRLHLGPLTIHAFGVLVAVAVSVGVRILNHRAHLAGLPLRNVVRFVNWSLLGGFIGAHLVDRLVYFPRDTLADPITLLRFWEGLSSFGGFLGGTVAALLFAHRHTAAGTAMKYVDSFVYAFPFGWIFGRSGCFVAFDHPGSPTHFFLAQVYKDGITRHNLGLYEALYTIPIAAITYILGRKPRHPGFFLSAFVLMYVPFRFGIDFLRIVDVRYFHLTPGQYGCMALFALALWLLARQRNTDKTLTSATGG